MPSERRPPQWLKLLSSVRLGDPHPQSQPALPELGQALIETHPEVLAGLDSEASQARAFCAL